MGPYLGILYAFDSSEGSMGPYWGHAHSLSTTVKALYAFGDLQGLTGHCRSYEFTLTIGPLYGLLDDSPSGPHHGRPLEDPRGSYLDVLYIFFFSYLLLQYTK